MTKKTKNILSICMVLLILAVLFAVKFTLDMQPRLGLDLRGGVSLVYQAIPAKGTTIDQDVLNKTVEKMRSRLDKLGVAEAQITTQGAKSVIVQLPGVHDPQRAKSIVGQTAPLQFRLVTESN